MTPQLRFPQFTNDWQTKKIGETLKIGSGKDYKHLDKGDIPVYGTGGLMLYVNDYLYDGKSIGIGRKGTIDKPQLLDGKFWTVDTLFYTHGYRDSSPDFLFAIFQRINWKKWNEASGVPSLSKSTIETIKIKVPSKPEQEKIADFLSLVDERLSLTETKLELLNKYRKGLMQKIFSQKLHFKDDNGNDYKGWVSKPLGELATVKTGKKDANIATLNGKYRFYTCARDFIHSDSYSFEGESILVAGNAEVGLCHYYDGKFEAYQRTYVLQDFKVDGKFLFRYLSHFFRQYALGLKQTSAMSFLKIDMLNNFVVPTPVAKEQQIIADFLGLIDDKISLEEKKLEQAKQYKKGLLQRLFV